MADLGGVSGGAVADEVRAGRRRVDSRPAAEVDDCEVVDGMVRDMATYLTMQNRADMIHR